MNFLVRFWGTRGSIPTPGHTTRRYGGNTSCVEVRVDDALFICDGGTGLRELGMHLVHQGSAPIEAHMFFSHMHWDHIQGFPFFVPAYSEKNQLHVYEVGETEDRIKRLLHGQMKSDYFPVKFDELGARIHSKRLLEQGTGADGVEIGFHEQHHPGTSYAYSFSKGGRKVVYATDNEIDLTLHNREESLTSPTLVRQIPEAFVNFVKGADLLIADGQYTEHEYARKVGWGHARANTVVDLAIQAGVKQCAIFHHDPMHSDAVIDQMIGEANQRVADQNSETTIFGAREGLTIKL
jgi:phosphoribosyl 1,2-cyclic phosphodiesterase